MPARVVHFVKFSIVDKYDVISQIFEPQVVREVTSRDLDTLGIPKHAYCFQYFDVQTAVENDIVMESHPFNFSPKYFTGGTLLTRREALKEIHDLTLARRIRVEQWFKVYRIGSGIYRHFKSGDKEYKSR